MVPESSRVINVSLACLIAFGSFRYSFFHQNVWAFFPTASVVLSLLLYSFAKTPSISHYFLYTLILTLSLLLGSSIVLLQSIIFSVGFFLVLTFVKGWHKEWDLLSLWLKRFFFLNLASGASIFILCGWFFYSFFLEGSITGYVRDAVYGSSSIIITPNLKFIIHRIAEYIQSGTFSLWSSVLGITTTFTGKNCFSPFFPIFFLTFMFYKTRNFWEFFIKSLLLGTIFYQEFIEWSPAFVNLMQNLLHLRPPVSFGPVIQIFGVISFAMCLIRIHSGELSVQGKQAFLIRALALILSFLYGSIFFVALLSILMPENLISFLMKLSNVLTPYINTEALRNLIPILIEENVHLFNQTMGFSSLLFYGLTAIIMVLFTSRYGFEFLKLKRGSVLAVVLLVNQIFLAWAVYPLNREPLLWERQVVNGKKLGDMFSPTDRIMRVGRPYCSHDKLTYYECVKNKILRGPFGSRRFIVGAFDVPALELSAAKSFTQKEVSEFIETLVKLGNPTGLVEELTAMGTNRLLVREPPLYSSKLYDISAVKYLWSQYPLPKTNRTKLIYSGKQFYLYKYLGSWPYYYLADRIDAIKEFKDLYHAEMGVAYVWDGDPNAILRIKRPNLSKMIKLITFEFDRMKFEYTSKQNEFLVINDAWHSQWRAYVNGIETIILKTNGIFKGIALPPGKGTVELFFDNTPYKLGIWITVVGWVFFLAGWCVFLFKSKHLKLSRM